MLGQYRETLICLGSARNVAVFIGHEGAPFPASDGSDIADRSEWEMLHPQVPDAPPEGLGAGRG